MNWQAWTLLGLLILMFLGAIRFGFTQARAMEESMHLALRREVTPLNNTCRVCGHPVINGEQCSHCGDLGEQ